jgi:ribosomal protein S18 acetylase RimI-like enzyme
MTGRSLPLLLFGPETLNIAETTRMIEVARACKGVFSTQFYGYGGEYERLIGEAGFVCHTLEPRLTPERAEELWKADRVERGGRFFTRDELVRRAHAEVARFERLRPAAVVIGFTMSTYFSARLARVPLVAVTPLALSRAFFDLGMGFWPDMLSFPPLTWLPDRWLDGAFNAWGRRSRLLLGTLNGTADTLGLPRWRRAVEFLDADEMLVANTPGVVGVDELPAPYRYVGPVFARLEGEVPREILEMPRDLPVVYFAMGSSANGAVLRRALLALAGLPCRVIAPVRRHLLDDMPSLPDRVLITDWLPAHKVNPLADVSFIHGGEGTVQTAAVSGTPFLGVGLQPEQEVNIEFYVRQGSAIRLRKREVSKARIAAALAALLQEPSYRVNARRVAEELAGWNGPENVVRFLAERYGGDPGRRMRLGEGAGETQETGATVAGRADARVESVELAPFVPSRDAPLLETWLRRPHVSRWWGDPAQASAEAAEPRAGGGEALIVADGVPAGYVRWQVPSREELDAAGLHDVPGDAVDIDIAIGEASLLDRGVGSRALTALRERLFRDGAPTVMLATSVDNARAVRSYEKAGFTRRRRFVDTDGETYWLMAADAPVQRSRPAGRAES